MASPQARSLTKAIVYLILILYLAITILPLYWIFTTAFKTEAESRRYPPTLIPKILTVANIIEIFTDSKVFGFRPFLNSLIISLGTSLVAVILSFLAGFGFSRYRFPGRDVLLLSMLFINLLPLLATIIPIFRLFSLYRLYDTYLGLILLHGLKTAPFTAWLMKGYIDTIPVELEESAMIDGCAPREAMRRIIAPLAAPGLAAVAVFGFRHAWNDFTAALILTTSREIRPYTIALYRFVGEQGQVEWHLISAAAFISVVPVVVSFAIFQKYFVTGLTGGAIKS
jgi:ABC-type glycerol-3-phosphate transport system permease component